MRVSWVPWGVEAISHWPPYSSVIFLAIALGSSAKSPRAVLLGSMTALILTSFLGVIAGGSIAHFFPEKLLKALAAIGFAILALKLLWPALNDEPD